MHEGKWAGVLDLRSIDVDRDEILSMRAFSSRNVLATKLIKFEPIVTKLTKLHKTPSSEEA